jgi:hypothetical protein
MMLLLPLLSVSVFQESKWYASVEMQIVLSLLAVFRRVLLRCQAWHSCKLKL